MFRRPLAALLLTVLAGPAAADAPSAQAAYAERRGLLEADAACNLFTPGVRSALQAGAWQARGALLRGGWTSARLSELESAAVRAARARTCSDPRTQSASERAHESFAAWTRLPSMTFQGAQRTWVARRIADGAGWRIVQYIDRPSPAAFGVQQDAVAFVLTLPAGSRAPASAELLLRDPARTTTLLFDVPGRAVRGLEGGAPAAGAALRFRARGRRVEDGTLGRRIVFSFADETLQALLALDPRESIVVQADSMRFLVEVGDFAAARAFLAAR